MRQHEIASITMGGLLGFLAQNPAISALVSILVAALTNYLQQWFRTRTMKLKSQEAEYERVWRENTNESGADNEARGSDSNLPGKLAGSDSEQPGQATG